MKITILTPTYNRAEKLKYLWESLLNQTSKDFEWFVVDDGSTDNTRELINFFQAKSDFSIRYLYKNNEGKHTALNAGIDAIDSELTYIVDSDDIITADAVWSIKEVHEKYGSLSNICGYTFLRAFPDGRINGKKFEENEMIASYIETRVNNDDTYADKAEIFLTKCLKEFPFPEYTGEKFLGEDIVWVRMARKYKMVHINKAIYIANYLDDGLTKNRRKHNIASPIGCMHRAEEFMSTDIKFRYRIKSSIQYVIYGKFAGNNIRALITGTKHKGILVMCTIPGLVLYYKWKKAFTD